MPEWLEPALGRLRGAFPNGHEMGGDQLVAILVVALALGCAVAGVYRLTRRPTRGAHSLVPTLVLLTVLIAMVTLVIGDSMARAFGLVGALAIVRFRTVVEDTRDTAFVIFAVAVGMAVGAGFLTVVLAGLPVAAVAALLFRQRAGEVVARPVEHLLTIRVGVGADAEAVLAEAFAKHLHDRRLVATATARQGAALDLTYMVRLRDENGSVALISELNGREGVQGVELRQA